MKAFAPVITLAVLLCLASGCQDKAAMAELEAFRAQEKIEKANMALYWRAYDTILNKRSLSIIDDVVSTDYVFHDPHSSLNGPDELKQGMGAYLAASSDLKFTVEEMVATGDRVVKRWKIVFTHDGDLNGIPPTGQKVTSTGTSMARFADGKLAEEWEAADYLGLMQQLGMELKPTEEGK